MNRYFGNILNALTQLLGAFSGRTLNANESTSGSAWRRRNEDKFNAVLYRVINAIFFWQDDHCKSAALQEVADSRELLEAYGYDVQIRKPPT